MNKNPAQYKKPPANNRAKVEAHLKTLQDANRLAIHTFEELAQASLFYPHKTRKQLEANEGMSTSELLRDHRPATLSLSLIPPSGKAMTPFQYYNVGYLFDLSVGEKKSPALVIKAFADNGNTEENNFAKQLHFRESSDLEALQTLYKGHNAKSFKHAVADDPTLSEKQLDALGEHYASNHAPYETDAHNEIVTVVQKDHVAAIAVSYRPPYNDKAMTALKGALAGLAHLKQGVNLPVVMYTTHGLNCGKLTYLAQGQEECKKLGLDAIRTLRREGVVNLIIDSNYQKECREFLGVDVLKPYEAQFLERGRG